MKITGLIFAAVVGLIMLIKFSMLFGLVGCVVGFFIGNIFSDYWHKGTFQRWCYWNLPTKLIAKKSLPGSNIRKLI